MGCYFLHSTPTMCNILLLLLLLDHLAGVLTPVQVVGAHHLGIDTKA